MRIRCITAAHLRYVPQRRAHVLACGECGVTVDVPRTDRRALVAQLCRLHDAGWVRAYSSAQRRTVCPRCRPPLAPSPHTMRSPAGGRSAVEVLRQVARHSTGETRRWALVLLAEWGG